MACNIVVQFLQCLKLYTGTSKFGHLTKISEQKKMNPACKLKKIWTKSYTTITYFLGLNLKFSYSRMTINIACALQLFLHSFCMFCAVRQSERMPFNSKFNKNDVKIDPFLKKK